jgi:hypothetical protein
VRPLCRCSSRERSVPGTCRRSSPPSSLTAPAAGAPGEAATVAQSTDFITCYQQAAGRPWTDREAQDAWAAGLWVRLFNAKKDAADGGGPRLDRLAGEISERLALAALDNE